MKKSKVIGLILSASAMLSGCGSVNNALAEKSTTVEYYRIFNVETNSNRSAVIKAASNGLGRNINSANESTPIPNFSTPPEQSGRFHLVNPFAGSNMASLAAANGVSLKIATCDGAVWVAQATREIQDSSTLKLTSCLWQYKNGYHLDVYASFNKQTGGLMQISRSLSDAMVGTSEEWTEKTFLDIVREIRKETGAKITYLEGYPEMHGTPWLDTEKNI
ncbi:hypothetical protein [Vibrio gangliei]|uniref:hypothetical protein n=1 Tax=Vibrio gangliei TaxID=2077090 RepID=UPI001FEB76DC|nr:hypothetical protein [Vibrio gangliei]